MSNRSYPLVPRNPDGVLRVIAIGRISTPQQSEDAIRASFTYVDEFLATIHDGPLHVIQLGEQASGMDAQRETILEAERLIESGEFDLVIAEDLSRIYRNPRHQWAFVQDAIDAGVRVICIADNLDTADDRWSTMLVTATVRHGLFLDDNTRRVKRSGKDAFHHGGMVQKVKFGYRKLKRDEADSGEFGPKGLRIAKIPELTPTIREMVARFHQQPSFRALADWLEQSGIAPGEAVVSGRWTDKLVGELLRDPILSGTRTYGDYVNDPVYKTGRPRAKKSNSPETEYYPSLAHITLEEQQALWSVMDRLSGNRTIKQGRDHSRFNVPQSRSIWPGQHARCAVCNGLMYYLDRNHAKCENSYIAGRKTCWNHLQLSCQIARQKTVEWLVAHLRAQPAHWQAFVDSAWTTFGRAQSAHKRRSSDGSQRLAELRKQAKQLAKAIGQGGRLAALVEELAKVEGEIGRISTEMSLRAGNPRSVLDFSREEFCNELEPALMFLARTSFEFAELMRRAFPVFRIQPIQSIDHGLVRPRAQLTFDPSAFLLDRGLAGQADQRIDFALDLFKPPVHFLHLQDCMDEQRSNPDHSLKRIAATLGIGRMTVKRAFDVARRMETEGLSEPYRVLTAAPATASRWKAGA